MTKITLTDKKGQAEGLEVPNLRDPVVDTDATNKRFVDAQLISKVDKVAGKGLSSEDFTSAEKAKLAAINAEENKALVDAQLISKVDKVAGKGLSSEDFTTAEKAKLAEIVTTLVNCSVDLLDPLPELFNATVSLEGKALLSDAEVSFFTVTDWVNGTHTVPAIGNKATLTLVVPEYPCDPLSITVVAVDNYTNKSKVVTRTVAVQDTIVMPPVLVVPVVPVASMSFLTFTSKALAISNGSTDVHVSTDWELWTGAGRTGTLVWSSINDTVNKVSISVPSTVTLNVSSKYYLVVRYLSLTYGLSSYAEASFLTSDQQVPAIGEPFQGGYYAGKFTLGGHIYALVVAPKAQGEYIYDGYTPSWGHHVVTSTGVSIIDGLANSNAATSTVDLVEKFCRGLNIGGFIDWYMPSYYELELLYFNLNPYKLPPSIERYSFSGYSASVSTSVTAPAFFAPSGNPYAIPARPVTATYVTHPPLQGRSIANQTQHPTYWSKFFWSGVSPTEMFVYDVVYYSSSWWLSVQWVGGYPYYAQRFAISFGDGRVTPYAGNKIPFRVRATRKVLLS